MCTYAHYIICKWSKVIPLNCMRHMYTQRGNFSLMEIVLMAWHCVFERGIVFSCYAHSCMWCLFIFVISHKKLLMGASIIYFLTLFSELVCWVIEEEMTRYHFKVKVRWRSKATLMTLHWNAWIIDRKFNEALKNSWKSFTSNIFFYFFTLGKFLSHHFANILIKKYHWVEFMSMKNFSYQMQWRRNGIFTFHRFWELSFSNRSSLWWFFFFIRKRREIWILMEIICIF